MKKLKPSSYLFGTNAMRSASNSTKSRVRLYSGGGANSAMPTMSGGGTNRVSKSPGSRRHVMHSNRYMGTKPGMVPMGSAGYGPKQ